MSFLVACETAGEVDSLEARLRDGGSELMPLGSYPFSERYAWVIDRYGLSWQIMAMGGRKAGRNITPTLMFVGSQCGRVTKAFPEMKKFDIAGLEKAAIGK